MKTTNKTAKTVTINFHECEHEGDLEAYVEDVVKSGGKIVRAYMGDDEGYRVGIIVVEIAKPKEFLAAFRKTDSADYSNI